MAGLPADAQAMQKEFVHLGEEIQKLANSRQQLAIQLNENEGVLAELNLLSSEAELFRAVGSALVRTESSDAKALISGRVDMIKKELAKTEQIVQEKGKRRLELQAELQKLQQQALEEAQKKPS